MTSILFLSTRSAQRVLCQFASCGPPRTVLFPGRSKTARRSWHYSLVRVGSERRVTPRSLAVRVLGLAIEHFIAGRGRVSDIARDGQ
jgi:hypothetical protein